VRLTHKSVIFIHGLRGHPRTTWEYAAPVQQNVAVTASTGVDVAPAKKRNWLDKLKSKSPSPSRIDELGLQVADNSDPAGGSKTIYWPAELLPSTVPSAKIWTYGYNADVVGGLFQANNKNSILQHGNDFMVKVERALRDEVGTPLVKSSVVSRLTIT
jgi:hypothetical protein